MSTSAAYANLVINLHEQGYVHDFTIIGNNIWWIQGLCYLPMEDCEILECHEIPGITGSSKESFVFGLLATAYNVRGILIEHSRINLLCARQSKGRKSTLTLRPTA